jgi:ribosomal protein S12 methylthiotransferase accessory factor YcaO
MMRMLGVLLLAVSLLVIAVMVVRIGTATVAGARAGEPSPQGAQQQAVLEVSQSVTRTVKYLVIPAALLLLAGVLIRGGRRDERVHELRVETSDDQ